jgi:hypothetical protein
MKLRLAVISATVAALATPGVSHGAPAVGGRGGPGGRAGITRFTINSGCTSDNTNTLRGTQVISRSPNSCGASTASTRVSKNSNGGAGGNGGNARSGNAFNRF